MTKMMDDFTTSTCLDRSAGAPKGIICFLVLCLIFALAGCGRVVVPPDNRQPTRTPDPPDNGQPTQTPDPPDNRQPTRTPDPPDNGQPTQTPDPPDNRQPTRTPDPPDNGQPTQTPDPPDNGSPNSSSCPAGTITTHPSLGLGCIAEEEFLLKVEELSRDYSSEQSFQNQWGLKTVNADRAYAHLHLIKGADAEPGEGVTIGFIDSGIDKDHPSFSDTDVTEKFLKGATDETGSSVSHGTFVASVAAGDRASGLDNAHHGVAWGADITMFAIPLGSGDSTYEPISSAQLNQLDIQDSEIIKSVLGENIDILNLSIGIDGNIEDYSENQLRSNYGRTIAALAQENAGEKTIIVWSAGNSNGISCDVNQVGADRCVNGRVKASSPGYEAGLAVRIEELRGHFIAVASVREDGSIASSSNRCGIAADHCISAPGVNVRGAYFGPVRGVNGQRTWGNSSGTSFSAPMVSGALAVMKQLFRDQLSNVDLVSRMFATADKTGIYADRSIYGQGLLDIGAATNPWGMVAFMGTGRTVMQQDGRTGVAGSFIHPSRALGDSFTRALEQREVAAFDELGAPFWFAAGDFVHNNPQSLAPARLNRLFTDSENGWGRDPGHLEITGDAVRFDLSSPDDWSAAFFHRPQERGNRPFSGFTAEWRPEGLSTLALQAGWLAEQDSLLGSSASGAFGELAGRTTFLSARLETDGPPGWLLSAQGELGVVSPEYVRGLLIRDISTLRTGGFRVAATHAVSPNGATVRFAMKQPVRVTEGVAVLDLPTGRTVDGLVVGETVSVELVPTGRQLDLSVRTDHPLAGGTLALESVWSRQPGHRADAPAEWAFLAGWKKRL